LQQQNHKLTYTKILSTVAQNVCKKNTHYKPESELKNDNHVYNNDNLNHDKYIAKYQSVYEILLTHSQIWCTFCTL